MPTMGTSALLFIPIASVISFALFLGTEVIIAASVKLSYLVLAGTW